MDLVGYHLPTSQAACPSRHQAASLRTSNFHRQEVQVSRQYRRKAWELVKALVLVLVDRQGLGAHHQAWVTAAANGEGTALLGENILRWRMVLDRMGLYNCMATGATNRGSVRWAVTACASA